MLATAAAAEARVAVNPGARWSFWYDPEARPGALNMAIDQTLLERAGRDGEWWLRLYRWSPHCLSFGRHEPALRRYDREAILARGLDVVRRPTGGRAVWHARELTYAVALPLTAGAGGLRAVYLDIHRMLQAALRAIGAPAELAPKSGAAGLDAGACFARPVGGEICVAGRKVVGSAQLREGGALLQHGAVLLDDDQAMVRRVTLGAAPADGSAPLARVLGRAVTPGRLAGAIADAASARWGGDWTVADGAPLALDAARRHQPRFESDAWTWRA